MKDEYIYQINDQDLFSNYLENDENYNKIKKDFLEIKQKVNDKDNTKIFHVNKNVSDAYLTTKKYLNRIENNFFVYFLRIITLIFVFINIGLVIYFLFKYKKTKSITYLNYAIWLFGFFVLFCINYLIVRNMIIINI